MPQHSQSRIFLYIVIIVATCVVPFAGIVIGIVCLWQNDEELRRVGKICLIISAAYLVLSFIVLGLSFGLLGLGGGF